MHNRFPDLNFYSKYGSDRKIGIRHLHNSETESMNGIEMCKNSIAVEGPKRFDLDHL